MENDPDKQEKTPTFADKVNDVVTQLTETKDGKFELPEGVEADESVLYAATIEKRRRTDQAAYTKSRQEAKALEVTNTKLAKHLLDNATMHLTDEQREELDNLRVGDPEAWRAKINQHEAEARNIIASKVKELEKEGSVESQLELRELQYTQFTEETGITLNDDIVENELPASYSKQLNDGTITFKEFLDKAKKFLTTERTVKKDIPENKNTDLGDLPGGALPSKEAQEKDSIASYKGETY